MAKNRRTWGAGADSWLQRLPELIAHLCRRWEVELDAPFTSGYGVYYVAPGRRADGTAVVLKAAFPNPESVAEIRSLQLCAGDGAVELLEVDDAETVMLQRRLLPGTMLTEVADDAEACRIGAGAMRRYRRPIPPNPPFPTTEEWWGRAVTKHRRLYGGAGPIPARYFDEADRLFSTLHATASTPVVLHGDLHHENILADGDGWTVIDPHGVMGEPAYEVGSFLRNPLRLWRSGDQRALVARRVRLFAELLQFEERRIAEWSAAQSVLACVWSADDGSGLPPDGDWLRCIETMFAVLDQSTRG